MSFRELTQEIETDLEAMIEKAGAMGSDFIAKLLHKKAMAIDPAAVAASLSPMIGKEAADLISNAGTGADRGPGDAGKQNPNMKADGATLVQDADASKGTPTPAAQDSTTGQDATAKPKEAPKDPIVS